MRDGLKAQSLWVLVASVLLAACGSSNDSVDNTLPDASVGDTATQVPASDVAISNDVAPMDVAPTDVQDACVIPSSCDVLFTLPYDGQQSVELYGDFNDWKVGLPMNLSGKTWSVELPLAHQQVVLYKLVIDGTTWISDPANPEKTSDEHQNSIRSVDCSSVCGGNPPQPDAGPPPTAPFDWRDALIYFVLLDRFADGDPSNNKPENDVEGPANFQGGDLAGLLDKIKTGFFEQLGVNALWLSSPVDAPDGRYQGDDGHYYTGYHGYWPTELDQVEERLGTLALLQQVVAEAHQRGLRVLIDYVMNHVHENSSVFKQNPGWFWSLDYQGSSCVCGNGCSWDWEPERLRCWFQPYLPDFNFQDPTARSFSIDNAVKWAKDTGVDGFRLDAVKHIEKSWLIDLRARLVQEGLPSAGGPFYLVGETFTDDKGLLKQYVDPPTMLDGQFDFPLRAELVRVILRREGTFYDLESFLNANDGFYGPGAVMGTFLGNHDLPRSIHHGEDWAQFDTWSSGKSRAWNDLPGQPAEETAYQRLGVGFAALLTLPGMPLIYYGDEIGLAGGGDPDNRRFMDWGTVKPPQQALRLLVSKLGEIRAAHPALRRGKRQQLWVADDVYAYRMSHSGDEVVVVLNRGDADATIFLPTPTSGNPSYEDLLTGGTVAPAAVLAPARSALVLR